MNVRHETVQNLMNLNNFGTLGTGTPSRGACITSTEYLIAFNLVVFSFTQNPLIILVLDFTSMSL